MQLHITLQLASDHAFADVDHTRNKHLSCARAHDAQVLQK